MVSKNIEFPFPAVSTVEACGSLTGLAAGRAGRRGGRDAAAARAGTATGTGIRPVRA